APFNIRFITTDNWGSYAREVAPEKHLIGKMFTQRIERHNLNLRIYIKRLREEQFVTHVQWKSTTNSLAHILKNIITTLWSHDPIQYETVYPRIYLSLDHIS
ncbi:hypothetical protein KKI98_23005, partial [Xenorhabdus bovienii]|nr:hypothetical protein [Xenorhabdus bovienii]